MNVNDRNAKFGTFLLSLTVSLQKLLRKKIFSKSAKFHN